MGVIVVGVDCSASAKAALRFAACPVVIVRDRRGLLAEKKEAA
jgi:hypothetical protein